MAVFSNAEASHSNDPTRNEDCAEVPSCPRLGQHHQVPRYASEKRQQLDHKEERILLSGIPSDYAVVHDIVELNSTSRSASVRHEDEMTYEQAEAATPLGQRRRCGTRALSNNHGQHRCYIHPATNDDRSRQPRRRSPRSHRRRQRRDPQLSTRSHSSSRSSRKSSRLSSPPLQRRLSRRTLRGWDPVPT